MLEKIEKYELIITTSAIKKELLKEASRKKKIIKNKILSKAEFINEVSPHTNEKSLYYLMKTYDMNYTVAEQYLKNIYITEEPFTHYYKELKKEKLIEKNDKTYDNALIIETEIDDIYKEKIRKVECYEITNENHKHEIYEFSDIEDEIVGVATQIITDLKTIDINDMYLVIPSDEYQDKITRIFKMFNIPIGSKTKKIYSTVEVQEFIEKLKEGKDPEKALEKNRNSEIIDKIVEILNKYAFIKQKDDKYIEIIENELKKAVLKQKIVKNTIKIISPEEIGSRTKHYYILGFNQNSIPKIYEEDGFINDNIKKNNKLLTSIENTKIEKQRILKIIMTYPNIYISYKLKDNQNIYYPSSLIEELNSKIVKKGISLNYSNKYNKLLLAKLLDNYLNYGEKNENLSLLYKTYHDIEYKIYNNKFKKLKAGQVFKYLNNNLRLSYSSINNFYKCAFKYYIENILKINENENTISITIGNMFHSILENIYKEDYDFDVLFTKLTKEMTLTAKETFYMNKIKSILKEDIEVIKMQDNKTMFKNKETEKQITIQINKNPNIIFTGIIDKIISYENNLVVIDYKTGSASATLENIDDGLNLQLPSYIYLIKKGVKDKKIVGFYLQKLLNSQKIDKEESFENNLKLEGYTIDDEEKIRQIDQTYEDSEIIKGMKKTKNGFYSYTKLIKEEEINKISEIVEEKINNVIKNIEEGNFDINPKKINKEAACKYCKYKDLCYKEEDDIVEIKPKQLKEIVGDSNA